jgi:hypothetical protein
LFASAQEFGSGDIKLTVQPSYIIQVTSAMFTGVLCTLKVNGSRVTAKAIRCHPKCDTGLVAEVNPIDNAATVFTREPLYPGLWSPIVFGIIRSTNTTVSVDSLEAAIY